MPRWFLNLLHALPLALVCVCCVLRVEKLFVSCVVSCVVNCVDSCVDSCVARCVLFLFVFAICS